MKYEEKIKLDCGEVTVRRLQINEVAKVLKKMKSLPGTLNDVAGKKGNEVFEKLPEYIAENIEDFAGVLSVPTSLKREEILELDLADFFGLLEGILEVNRYEDIKRFLGKMLSRAKKEVAKK